jgi:glycosyltransferase involved in cell wall biosynthesis
LWTAVDELLKVLLVYYEPQPSGQTAHVLSLARGLDRQRFDITVVLPQGLERAATDLLATGVRVVPLRLRKLAWHPPAILDLARIIRELPADLVHVHGQEAGLIARSVARLAGPGAIFYTPQTIDLRRGRWQALYRLVERALARITATIISVNEADRRRLVEWGIPAGKVVTVPNGIDLSAFGGPVDVAGLHGALGLEDGQPLVLQVGRLTAQKDPIAFVEGAFHVVRQCPAVHFALVGDGPLRDSVAARIRQLGLEGKVHLLGWRPEAFRLMAAADIVTLTSRWEGAPYALLEAMAWARPVVAPAVNGCPEIVADGLSGLLVPAGDLAGWARAVVTLLNDLQKAAAMGHQGRQRVEEHYTLPQMIARLESLYEGAAGPRNH